MPLHNYVIHELEKVRGGIPNLRRSLSLPPVNRLAENLLSRLLDKYKQQVAYGVFGDTGATPFRDHFDSYCASSRDGASFLTFTTQVCTALSAQIRGIGTAIGGYLLFADYEHQTERFVSTYLIRNVDGFQFSQGTEHFDVASIPHLGIDKVAMACRINVTTYLDEDATGNYLSFARGGQVDSNYFYNWIGAEELHQSSQYTDRLVEIFREIELPQQIGEIVSPDRDLLRHTVAQYCQSLPGRQLNLLDLSRELYGDDQMTKIIDFAEEKGIQIAAQFTPEKRKMRRMSKVFVQSDGITLNFPFRALTNQTITLPGDGIVLIHSPDLEQQINSEIHSSEDE